MRVGKGRTGVGVGEQGAEQWMDFASIRMQDGPHRASLSTNQNASIPAKAGFPKITKLVLCAGRGAVH